MRRILLAGVTTLMATAMLGSASANTISFTVDCSKGQTIGAALQRGDARKPLLLMLRISKINGKPRQRLKLSRLPARKRLWRRKTP